MIEIMMAIKKNTVSENTMKMLVYSKGLYPLEINGENSMVVCSLMKVNLASNSQIRKYRKKNKTFNSKDATLFVLNN
jgi:hypothetical protein